MLPDIKHFQVNWVDGMKISSGDFIAFENALFDNVRDVRAARLNEFEYGLLPTNNPEVDNYPKLEFDYAKGELVLKECRAITPGGQRIEITEDNFKRKKFPAGQPAVPVQVQAQGRFDVYIFVDTAARLGAGEVANNNPPRFSMVSPKYELSLKSHDERAMIHDNFLKISELDISDGRVNILTSTGRYIPPCTSINAHSFLKQTYSSYEERIKGFVQKYSDLANKLGDTSNKSAIEVKEMIEKMVAPIVSSRSYYKYMICNQPPISMIAYFKDYFAAVRFQLERPLQAKKVIELKSALLELIADLERNEPDHSAILKTLTILTAVLEKFNTFLAELVKYDFGAWSPDIIDFNRTVLEPKPVVAAEIVVGNQPVKKEAERRY